MQLFKNFTPTLLKLLFLMIVLHSASYAAQPRKKSTFAATHDRFMEHGRRWLLRRNDPRIIQAVRKAVDTIPLSDAAIKEIVQKMPGGDHRIAGIIQHQIAENHLQEGYTVMTGHERLVKPFFDKLGLDFESYIILEKHKDAIPTAYSLQKVILSHPLYHADGSIDRIALSYFLHELGHCYDYAGEKKEIIKALMPFASTIPIALGLVIAYSKGLIPRINDPVQRKVIKGVAVTSGTLALHLLSTKVMAPFIQSSIIKHSEMVADQIGIALNDNPIEGADDHIAALEQLRAHNLGVRNDAKPALVNAFKEIGFSPSPSAFEKALTNMTQVTPDGEILAAVTHPPIKKRRDAATKIRDKARAKRERGEEYQVSLDTRSCVVS